jgi:hypothetical protein
MAPALDSGKWRFFLAVVINSEIGFPTLRKRKIEAIIESGKDIQSNGKR